MPSALFVQLVGLAEWPLPQQLCCRSREPREIKRESEGNQERKRSDEHEPMQAMLFDSPIGGIAWPAVSLPLACLAILCSVRPEVYMFEEITSSSWPVEAPVLHAVRRQVQTVR